MSVEEISDDRFSTGLYPASFSYRETVGNNLHYVGLALTWGLNKAMDWTIHSFCNPIRPGQFDNLDTYNKELAARVAAVVVSMLLGIPLLGLHLVGHGVNAIADRLTRKEYIHLEGTSQVDRSQTKWNFYTHNTCMFWPWGQIFGGGSSETWRIDDEVKVIKALSPDFVCLQEVDFIPALQLQSRLKDSYKHTYVRIGPKPPLMGSCLFLASKHPIIGEPVFVELEGLQNGMRRGFFYVETEKFFVFTTHLDPSNKPISQDQRRKQLSAILETMQTLKKPCFLLGDLNVVNTGKPGDEYSRSGIPGNFIDPNHDLTPTCTDYLNDVRKGKPNPQHNWELVDYALARGVRQEQLSVRLIPAYELENPDDLNSPIKNPSRARSDHTGLLLTYDTNA